MSKNKAMVMLGDFFTKGQAYAGSGKLIDGMQSFKNLKNLSFVILFEAYSLIGNHEVDVLKRFRQRIGLYFINRRVTKSMEMRGTLPWRKNLSALVSRL